MLIKIQGEKTPKLDEEVYQNQLQMRKYPLYKINRQD